MDQEATKATTSEASTIQVGTKAVAINKTPYDHQNFEA